MKTVVLFLLFLSAFSLHAQDSLKTKGFVLNVQGYPDTTAFEHDFVADRTKGLWVKNYALEKADSSVHYFLKEKKKRARVEPVEGNKNAFYVTPDAGKLKKMKRPIIEIEVYVTLSKDNIYFPIKKEKDLRLLDNNRKVIEENVTWKNYRALKKKKGRYLLGSLFYNVQVNR